MPAAARPSRPSRGTLEATALLGGMAFFTGAIETYEVLATGSADPALELLGQVGLAALVAHWLAAYRRENGGLGLFDEGLFCLLIGPLLIPIYVVAARGRSSLVAGLVPLGVCLLSAIVGGACVLALFSALE